MGSDRHGPAEHLELAVRLSGTDVRYPVPGVDRAAGPGAELVGRRMPHQLLPTGTGVTGVAELLRTGQALLLVAATTGGDELVLAASGWAGRVRPVGVRVMDGALAGLAAVLVRPDGHVAEVVAAGTGPQTGRRALRIALRRWFGDPDVHGGGEG